MSLMSITEERKATSPQLKQSLEKIPSNEWSVIPEIIQLVFTFLNSETLPRCALVNREWYKCSNNNDVWNLVIRREIHQNNQICVFDKEQFESYIGKIDEEPNYPRDLSQILSRKCPFFPEKTIGETHFVIYIPSKINGIPLTLNLIIELFENKFAMNENFHEDIFEHYGNKPIENAGRWLFITKEIIPNSTNLKFENQTKLVNKFGYTPPKILEVVLSFFFQLSLSEKKSFFRNVFSKGVLQIYSKCVEKVNDRRVDIGLPNNYFYIGLISDIENFGILAVKYYE